MTKQDELNILDRAIDELGTASYLGPVLAHLRDHIESEMRSDIIPDIVGAVKDLQSQKAALSTDNTKLIYANTHLTQEIAAKEERAGALEKRIKRAKDDMSDLARALLSFSK